MTLGLAVIFEYFKKFPCFTVFLVLTQFNRRKLWCPIKSIPFNYSSLSYIVLTLTSAVSNLSDITLIFHDLPCPTIKYYSMTFQAWKMKIFNFITFQVFHDLLNPAWIRKRLECNKMQGLVALLICFLITPSTV